MKPSVPMMAMGLIASTLGLAMPAQADDPALTFELPPSNATPSDNAGGFTSAVSVPAAEVPSRAPIQPLPPAPEITITAVTEPQSSPLISEQTHAAPTTPLTFALPVVSRSQSLAAQASSPSEMPSSTALFAGGSDSLIARAVGSAEGTRTPEGDRTKAYYGHTDPGNGVWNLGSFSYQHGADSPEQADVKQLQRLQTQLDKLQQKAEALGVQLSLEETLNGVDLANQSPRAALDRGGYVERLKQARDMGFSGEDAILWARVRSYLDPDTQQWSAPGLGNTLESITHDQDRRMRQVNRAIALYPAAHLASSQTQPVANSFAASLDDATEKIISFNF
jgi:hypothetical protein